MEELNKAQREAVEYCDGPSLVIAGAGSGKTRVLTYKIAHLLRQGMMAWNILALTFTNKAAREMKSRIAGLVGEESARYLNMGTFHSVFSHILRVEAERIGFSSNFTIYDEADSRSLIKSIVKELGLDEKLYKPATVHHRISMAKNHLILASDYSRDRSALQRDHEQRMPALAQIYLAYSARCKQANAMDFDDLLVLTYVLFRDNEDVRRKYVERFMFILVDEYQDTNSAQQKILWQLTKERQRICVVGDDAQSIYGFRGANIDNILDFQQMYSDARLFKLEQNYRSTQLIVQAANSLIRHNERRIPKDVYSRNDEGGRILLKNAYSDKEEAIIVCNEIRRIRREDGCGYDSFAILYRTNAQSRSFEEALLKENLPYRIYGGLSFYQRKEIKDILAYFRLINNPDDEEALKRVVNYPARGIGGTTIAKIADAAAANAVSLWQVASEPARYGLDLNRGTMSKLDAFRNLILSFVEKAATEDACQLGTRIIKESGIAADLYSETSPEAVSRQENMEEFINSMHDFVAGRREEGREREVAIGDFLQEVSLLTDLDSKGDAETKRITLMTIHSAKGLEFPTVFIVGMEENLFPSQMCSSSKREIEEERRLLYVAMTRAERHCIMTCAKNRYRYGRMEFNPPSRFLRDIDPRFIRVDSETSHYGASAQSSPFGGQGYGASRRWQNSNPVASQFRADPMPRQAQHREEPPRDPFSDGFKRSFAAAGGNLKRVSQLSGVQSSAPSQGLPPGKNLSEGSVIEHERFGEGRVLRVEGSGENTKATVEFRNAGVKQLLLKFARFKVIS